MNWARCADCGKPLQAIIIGRYVGKPNPISKDRGYCRNCQKETPRNGAAVVITKDMWVNGKEE